MAMLVIICTSTQASQVHIASWLIENGADVNEIDDRGISLFSLACQSGFPKCVELLLKKNPNLVFDQSFHFSFIVGSCAK